MLDLKERIKESLKNKSSGVVEEKYLLVITRYPNGSSFPKIFPISKAVRKANTKKKKVRKEVKQLELAQEEVY